MTRLAVMALLLLAAGCASRQQALNSYAPERELKNLNGRIAYSDPISICTKCLLMVCAHPGKELPFLGPDEAKGDINPNPAPVIIDSKRIKTSFTAGDHVTFDLSVNWNSDTPLQATSMKLVKHGPPSMTATCPDSQE